MTSPADKSTSDEAIAKACAEEGAPETSAVHVQCKDTLRKAADAKGKGFTAIIVCIKTTPMHTCLHPLDFQVTRGMLRNLYVHPLACISQQIQGGASEQKQLLTHLMARWTAGLQHPLAHSRVHVATIGPPSW